MSSSKEVINNIISEIKNDEYELENINLAGKTFIDIGCHHGLVSEQAVRLGATFIKLLDIDQEMLTHSLERIDKYGVNAVAIRKDFNEATSILEVTGDTKDYVAKIDVQGAEKSLITSMINWSKTPDTIIIEWHQYKHGFPTTAMTNKVYPYYTYAMKPAFDAIDMRDTEILILTRKV